MRYGTHRQIYAGLIPLSLFQFYGLFLIIQSLPLYNKLLFRFNSYNTGPFPVHNLNKVNFSTMFVYPFILSTLHILSVEFLYFCSSHIYITNYSLTSADRILSLIHISEPTS